LYQIVVDQLSAPDLLLFLDGSVATLLERIRGRDRAIESGITADYLGLLNTFYVDWLAGFDLCPVLSIPADRLDFVHHPDHLDVIVDRIQQKLAGKEVVVFE
jgi:deoxyadenosine/deoxycytidine kinase